MGSLEGWEIDTNTKTLDCDKSGIENYTKIIYIEYLYSLSMDC